MSNQQKMKLYRDNVTKEEAEVKLAKQRFLRGAELRRIALTYKSTYRPNHYYEAEHWVAFQNNKPIALILRRGRKVIITDFPRFGEWGERELWQ